MKRLLPASLAIGALLCGSALLDAHAGPTGYHRSAAATPCGAKSKFQTPRYSQRLPLRHYEDHRRYNAAPCHGEVVRPRPYLLETVVVRKERQARYRVDNRGRRHCRTVVVTTYKDLFSDGSCRVYTCGS